MRVLALDQATRAMGVCLLDNGRPKVLKTVTMNEKDPSIVRIIGMRDAVREVMKEYDPNIVVMEDYAYTQHSSADALLKELGGVIKVDLHERGYLKDRDVLASGGRAIIVQTSAKMKAFCLGNGNTGKDPKYLLTVFQHMKVAFDDDNQADAYMHAFMGGIMAGVLQGKVLCSNLYDYQQEALIANGMKKFKKDFKGVTITKALKTLDDEAKRRLVGW